MKMNEYEGGVNYSGYKNQKLTFLFCCDVGSETVVVLVEVGRSLEKFALRKSSLAVLWYQ